MNTDLTVIYYSAMKAPATFRRTVGIYLSVAIGTTNIMHLTNNKEYSDAYDYVDVPYGHTSIYRMALEGAKRATTKYIALAEDDVLYPKEHFAYRPSPGVFAYNKSVWSIYTWVQPPLFSYKDRRNMYSLICERELFIEAMEERFAKYPTDEGLFLGNWAEPGKYEKNLGVTERQTEIFYTNIPLVAFSHETALSFQNLGKRKKLGALRVTALPHWGSAEEVLHLYG